MSDARTIRPGLKTACTDRFPIVSHIHRLNVPYLQVPPGRVLQHMLVWTFALQEEVESRASGVRYALVVCR